MTITFQNLTSASLPLADEILSEAYDYGRRADRLRRYLRVQPDGWLVAMLDGQPAGIGGAINYGRIAYIGLVGVRPALQRRGVARALMERLVAWIDASGCPVILLDASAMGAPLYVQLGFVDDAPTTLYQRDKTHALPASVENVRPLREADFAAMAAFDGGVFGAGREALLRLLVDELSGRAFVAYDRDGQLSGYLLAQPSQIGPWAARTPAAAEALLGAALQLEWPEGCGVVVPGANAEAARMLERAGFVAGRVLRHMRRGGAHPPGERALMYGQASMAAG